MCASLISVPNTVEGMYSWLFVSETALRYDLHSIQVASLGIHRILNWPGAEPVISKDKAVIPYGVVGRVCDPLSIGSMTSRICQPASDIPARLNDMQRGVIRVYSMLKN